jgi:Protein of unknown function (DUF3551)
MVSAIVLSTFASVKVSALRHMPGRLYPLGDSCLTYDEGGSDCSFTSYAMCLATESGIGAVCFDNIAHDGEGLKFKAIIIMYHEPSGSAAERFRGKRRTDAMISTTFGFYFGKAADGLNNFSPFL